MNHYAELCGIHNRLEIELREQQKFPIPYNLELELRLGTLEYSPYGGHGKFQSGIQESAFQNLLQHFEANACTKELLWDDIYYTVDSRSSVRLSRDAQNNPHCICKTWVQDCQLEHCLPKYDARISLSRELPAALPLARDRPKHSRHKQRKSVLLCDGRWRLDLTRVFPSTGPPQYEVELEATNPAQFSGHLQLLQFDLHDCLSLLQQNMQPPYNNSHYSGDMDSYVQSPSFDRVAAPSPLYITLTELSQTIDSVYHTLCPAT